MRQCTQCAATVFNDDGTCTVCGKPSIHVATQSGMGSPAGPAPLESRGGAQRRELSISSLFATADRVVIGRSQECGICLPHPMVSARHAVLERQPGGLWIRPFDSARTVIVAGQRIRDPALIRDRRRFGIGPFLFTLADDALQYLDSSTGLRLEARGLEKTIVLPGGTRRKLLTGLDLVVEPGEFVSLLGPSGSGKSTLMDCLNGRRRATAGKVVANGEDFYAQYHTFRHSLGYVPQKDIVHAQLTVERALRYTAKLRLPKDIDESELMARVEEVLRQMELIPHRRTLIGNLSGGQIKRVSLGAELLARPSLLYIDEATSGLDAGTEARMMVLFRQLADDGKSVVCITHNVDSVDRCHLVLVLAGGRLIYYGPPHDAPSYFKVQRLGQIYDRIASQSVEQWADDFLATPLYDEFIRRRMDESQELEAYSSPASIRMDSAAAPADPDQAAGVEACSPQLDKTVRFRRLPPAPSPASGPHAHGHAAPVVHPVLRHMVTLKSNWHQFRILTRRYIELTIRDPKSLRLVLWQAPIVGLILALGLIHLSYDREMPLNVHLDDSQKSMLAYLHNFNVVLTAAEQHTVEKQAAMLKQIKFTVSVEASLLQAQKQSQKQDRDGYELAKDIEHLNDTLHVFNRPAVEVVLGADPPISGQEPPPNVKLRDLVALAHTLAAVDKGHGDIAQEVLQMDKAWPIVPHSMFRMPNACWSVMFILAVTVFWFGCNNAAKEIVREEAIYARERAAGIAILPYLGSKFLVLSVISAVQAFVLLFIVHGALRLLKIPMPLDDSGKPLYFLSDGQQLGIFCLLSITGIACGLLVSACVTSPDRATTLTPYILIPQIILGGSFIPIEHISMKVFASISAPVYWAYRALHHGTSQLPDYYAPYYHTPDYSVVPSYIALGIQMALMLVGAAWFLRRKDTGNV